MLGGGECHTYNPPSHEVFASRAPATNVLFDAFSLALDRLQAPGGPRSGGVRVAALDAGRFPTVVKTMKMLMKDTSSFNQVGFTQRCG